MNSVYKAVMASLVLASSLGSSAFAFDYDVVCKGRSENGKKIHVSASSSSRVILIEDTPYRIKSEAMTPKYNEITSSQHDTKIRIRFTKDGGKFGMKVDGKKYAGKCKSKYGALDDLADDTEHPDFSEEMIGD